jgi:anaerobic selenocysteine-containing dehydrogenase
MTHTVKLACPLDCFDACGLLAEVAQGRVIALRGDPAHPLARGRICVKGKKLLERLYHPQRLLTPRLKGSTGWKTISWEAALDLIADRFRRAIERHGRRALLHYADSGYGGLLKSVDRLFFNHLGPVSVPRGSLCWAAGIAAQRYDFGDVRGHAPHDMAKARCLMIWGRNPVATNPHLMPFVQEARRRGALLIVIDPLKTLSARQADIHLQPRPGTDGALALGMARHLLDIDRIDRSFIDRHTVGFKRLAASLKSFSPEQAAAITGIEAQRITATAETYAERAPACILIGMGLQRYANGGRTVRCIDALGALTGNIGRSGGGVNYANRSIVRWIERQPPGTPQPDHRTFPLAQMARFLRQAADPPIAVAMIAKANPLVQMPNTQALAAALAAVPFKIVVDMFMTDTAQAADLVLPCTSILEEEDLVYSSMFTPYLTYAARAVPPPEGLLGEYEIFRRLARRMDLAAYPDMPPRTFLAQAIRPLTEAYGVTLESLAVSPFKVPENDVPWSDGRFATPSGCYEFYSRRAAEDGRTPLPAYRPPHAAPALFPLRFLTPHHAHSMHSQQFAFRREPPQVALHPTETERFGLHNGQAVRISSPQGHIEAILLTDAGIPPGILKMDQGWWQQSGAANRLTADTLSDMGENAAYFETFCRIEASDSDQGGRSA